MSQDSENQDPEFPLKSETTDWESHAKKLLDQLQVEQRQAKLYQNTLKRIVLTHETDSEAVEALKHEVELRERDIRYLWQEIAALQHSNAQFKDILSFREKQLSGFQVEKNNADAKTGFLESTIARQQAIISRLEQEIGIRETRFQEIRKTRGWKIGKKIAGKGMDDPVDLSGLPPVPDAAVEPTYAQIEKIGPAPRGSDFVPEKDEAQPVAEGFHCELESPRSFVSPAIGQLVTFSGWCFDKNGNPPVKMWAELGENEYPVALGTVRDEVARQFADSIAVDPRCGFLAEVSTGPGENFITIHAAFSDGSKAPLFKRIVVNLGFETTPKRQLDEDYQSWIQCFDTLTEAEIDAQRSAAEKLKERPLFSVLLPVYNTEASLLKAVLDSVLNQTYERWELCIADDNSSEPHVRELLQQYGDADERIKVVFREQNGHISAATNSALEVATGEFCALLDHDDLLPVHALYHVAVELNAYPDADLLFSDEDKIDADGKRFDPYFKSDWNPDLFLSHNCISHLGVYRTSILREIHGFKEDLYGSQDWDMALRFLLKSSPERIRHIPRVLYHWRYLDSSTSKTIESKPYAVTAGRRAIENYLESNGAVAEVSEGMWPGAYRVKYQLPPGTKASILIPTRNQLEVTKRCIESILEHTEYPEFEILLIDNQSDEPDVLEWFESLKVHDKVRVLRYDHPFNYSAINNYAAKKAQGEVLVLLNNDVEVLDESWLEELVSQAMRKEIGVAGGWLLYPDHKVQHAGILMGVCGIAVEAFKFQLEWNIGHMGRAHLNQNYSAVTGACLATRKAVWDELGGLNEVELGVAYNDVDYCLRAKRDLGLSTTWTPYTKLVHHESVSRGYEISEEQQQRIAKEAAYMNEQWASVIERDPYYNANLSKYDPKFNLAWPPRLIDPGSTTEKEHND